MIYFVVHVKMVTLMRAMGLDYAFAMKIGLGNYVIKNVSIFFKINLNHLVNSIIYSLVFNT